MARVRGAWGAIPGPGVPGKGGRVPNHPHIPHRPAEGAHVARWHVRVVVLCPGQVSTNDGWGTTAATATTTCKEAATQENILPLYLPYHAQAHTMP